MKTTITLAQVQELAAKVQALRFDRFVNGSDDVSVLDKDAHEENSHIRLPLVWFGEAYAQSDFERIFRVWDGGLSSMQGKNLYARCLELVECIK